MACQSISLSTSKKGSLGLFWASPKHFRLFKYVRISHSYKPWLSNIFQLALLVWSFCLSNKRRVISRWSFFNPGNAPYFQFNICLVPRDYLNIKPLSKPLGFKLYLKQININFLKFVTQQEYAFTHIMYYSGLQYW